MVMLKGWKYVAFIGVIVGGIGATLYPIIIDPMINTEHYSKIKAFFLNEIFFKILFFKFTGKIQKSARAGINQAEIQPGSNFFLNQTLWNEFNPLNFLFTDMKVWSDPFDRTKSDK